MPDPNIHPLDWRALEKGSSISQEQILEFWRYHFPDKEWNEFSLVTVKEKIQNLRCAVNAPIVIKQTKVREGEVRFDILTDKEAPEYLAAQATAGIKKHRKNARRLLTDIDLNNLNEAEKRRLETKQIHHAFIAAATDGARKHSLQLQRKGKSWPKSVIEESKLRPTES